MSLEMSNSEKNTYHDSALWRYMDIFNVHIINFVPSRPIILNSILLTYGQ